MTIGAGPSPLPRVAVKLVIMGCDRTGGGRREVREDRIGLVLIPTLSSAIFGQVFGFDHGHFGARCNADIGMKPKALPTEKSNFPLMPWSTWWWPVRTLTCRGLSQTDGLLC